MRDWKKPTLIGVAVAAVCLISLGMLSRRQNHTASAAAVTRAAIATVKREPISNTFAAAGEFIPYQEVEVHAKVTGFIRKIMVDIGDRVKEGQVLAVLEVPELEAQVEGAEAGVRHSQTEIERAREELNRDEANHQAIHDACRRLKQAATARPGLVAQQEIDDAVAKDRASEAQVAAAKAALATAQEQLGISKASRSQVTAMSAYSRIVAPFSGVITWRYADTGALVQAGTSNTNAQPVVKLAEVDTLRLRVPVPESLAPSIHIGSNADITVQATGEHFTGRVSRLTNSLDRSTRTMQVEADVPNRQYRLDPGMFAKVVLQVRHDASALTLPVQAVNRSGDKATVLFVNPQNRVEMRDILTGIEDGNRIEVQSGLAEGDRVVIGNLSAFHAGQMVDPRPSTIAEKPPQAGGEQ